MKHVLIIVGLSIVHLFLSAFLFVSSFRIILDPDDPPRTRYESMAGATAKVLMFPVFDPICVRTPIGRLFPGVLGYIPMYLNSFAWASVGYVGLLGFVRLAKKRLHNKRLD